MHQMVRREAGYRKTVYQTLVAVCEWYNGMVMSVFLFIFVFWIFNSESPLYRLLL